MVLCFRVSAKTAITLLIKCIVTAAARMTKLFTKRHNFVGQIMRGNYFQDFQQEGRLIYQVSGEKIVIEQ